MGHSFIFQIDSVIYISWTSLCAVLTMHVFVLSPVAMVRRTLISVVFITLKSIIICNTNAPVLSFNWKSVTDVLGSPSFILCSICDIDHSVSGWIYGVGNDLLLQ